MNSKGTSPDQNPPKTKKFKRSNTNSSRGKNREHTSDQSNKDLTQDTSTTSVESNFEELIITETLTNEYKDGQQLRDPDSQPTGCESELWTHGHRLPNRGPRHKHRKPRHTLWTDIRPNADNQ